jgi:hypothetical protein
MNHPHDESNWETAKDHPIFPDGFQYDPDSVAEVATEEDDSLIALLGLSVETAQTLKEAAVEAAKERHPSALPVVDLPSEGDILTAADRCDDACTAGAVYRMRDGKGNRILDFCGHHWRKHAPGMADQGWKVTGTNPDAINAMYGDRSKGDDHA